MYIHKNGIKLQKLGREHLSLMLGLKEESWFGTHKIAFLNMDDELEWFEKQRKDANSLFLYASDSDYAFDHPVGVYKITNIDWMNRQLDSAYDVFELARGRGYGYKLVEAGADFCFEILNMNRLNAEVLVNNYASRKCIINGGFEPEGMKRRAIFKCGEYIDSEIFGLLRDDWSNLVRVAENGVCNISYTPKNEYD